MHTIHYGHAHIGEHNGNVVAMRHELRERGLSIARLEHAPAVTLQQPSSRTPHRSVVIDQQHASCDCGDRGGTIRRRSGHVGRVGGQRQCHAHRGALPEHALHLHGAARLCDHAVHHGEPKAGAACHRLCGEERLEDALPSGFVHTDAGVRYAQY